MNNTSKILIWTSGGLILLLCFFLYFQFILKKLTVAKQNNNVKAFLMMIRRCEGTSGTNGYNTMFGGKIFSDLSKHPNVCVPFRDNCSTAAGAYQFLYKTWLRLSLKLNLSDFSKENQDLAAMELIREKNALDDVVAGRIEEAIYKIRKVWASLPGAGYGQPEKSLATALTYYNTALATAV